LMERRFACINDLPIAQPLTEIWLIGPRPDEHPGLSDLGP
jgi:hypothetical protein